MRRVYSTIALCAVLVLAGCATFQKNPPLSKFDPAAGYRYTALNEADAKNTEDTFIILTFSGGGTRAAALAYGVLEHLRQARIDGGRKSLLDEVDVISSVSGGSFAAAYYGLFGEQAFFRNFNEVVLNRKIERDLILRVVAPWNWPRLLSPRFGRSDLASEYYDRSIFANKTFADMPRKRPFIILNATDMSLGAQFEFTQDDFDRLCSDLSGVHVARGVTASSAFPGAFTPLTLVNYPKSTCGGYQVPEWVTEGLKDFDGAPTRYERAKTWLSYRDATQRPYVHLNDGGLADNIGLRGPEVAITSSDPNWSLFNKVNRRHVTRIAVIVVDAKPQEEPKLDRCARPPCIYSVLNAAATNPMENYSSDSVELLREQFNRWAQAESNFTKRQAQATKRCDDFASHLCASSRMRAKCEEHRRTECYATFRETEADRPPSPKLYEIHVRLEAIKDPERRKRLQAIQTTLQLPREQVDLLIKAAATLLDQSEDYQRLMHDLAPEQQSGGRLMQVGAPGAKE
jgi:predicted acylesterase/phospholipase RssA